jgi:hypothetical protein
MWLFNLNGFASVVKNQRPEGGLLVRFRSKVDAENFVRDAFTKNSHSGGEIHENEKADYRWRVVVPRHVMGNYLLDTVDALEYGNFKDAVHQRPDQANKGGAYMDVWCAMHRVQADELRRRDPNHDRKPGHGGKLPLWKDLDLVRACQYCGKEREFQSTAPKAAAFRYKCTGCEKWSLLKDWRMPIARGEQSALPGGSVVEYSPEAIPMHNDPHAHALDAAGYFDGPHQDTDRRYLHRAELHGNPCELCPCPTCKVPAGIHRAIEGHAVLDKCTACGAVHTASEYRAARAPVFPQFPNHEEQTDFQ